MEDATAATLDSNIGAITLRLLLDDDDDNDDGSNRRLMVEEADFSESFAYAADINFDSEIALGT